MIKSFDSICLVLELDEMLGKKQCFSKCTKG